MSKIVLFAGAFAALALTAAACGIGPQASADRPTPNPTTVYHQFAQCIRDHGLPDFPDPTLDAQGQPHLPDGVAKPPDAILQACLSILNQLPPSSRPNSGDSQNDPAMMRRFAQCMRDHGIQDWPDPDSDGNFHFPPTLSGNIKTGPRWQQISAAWNGPCKQYDPSGHISSAA
jgi:hypothetical protein